MLRLVSRQNPENDKYIVQNATVWLNSGSPPMQVISIKGGIAETLMKDGRIFSFPVKCLTPEPSPVSV